MVVESEAEQEVNQDMKRSNLSAFPVLVPFHFLGYISGGTGSMIIQVVIASLVGGAFAVKLYWGRIKKLFRKEKAKGH